ncbi:FadR/GntR family transcriptional regulator [Desulforamulus ruminis]|uniref:GntR domain protein n=1 Tax=Desulforamulus ruminis (strain ATCC 23193 / DSM 2154 / NCIMB 8452 / DL) TaxID=696281 RepID=F6DSW1_DESRL|nr:GntR domain protein [Desulforamulus ruminis DSM 2154]
MFNNKIGRSDTLRNEVAGYIKTLISSGQLKPGDRLPTERVMSENFGVSRTVIRDAVKTLAGIGLLEVKHGVGIFVATVDGALVGRQLSNLLTYHLDTIEHIYEVRILLEKFAAQWAAERCTQEDYEKIKDLLEEAHTVNPIEYGDRFADLNRKFHLLIAEASQNPVIAMMVENILDLLENVSDETHTIPGRANLSIEQHEKVLELIIQHKPQEAKRAMEEHLSSVLTTLKKKNNPNTVL